MKRRICSDHSFDGADLKRRSSSLFSIATVHDESVPTGQVPLGELPLPTTITNSNNSTTTTIGECNADGKPSNEPAASVASTLPSMAETDSDGFYIEDDDDNNNNNNQSQYVSGVEIDLVRGSGGQSVASVSSSVTKPAALSLNPFNSIASFKVNPVQKNGTTSPLSSFVSSKVVPTTTTTTTSSIVSDSDQTDLRTGVIFEAGQDHFDRRNKFHKERPLRVTSVRDALIQSDLGFAKRCAIFKDGTTNQDDNDDQDATQTSPEQAFLDDDDYLRSHLPGYMQR